MILRTEAFIDSLFFGFLECCTVNPPPTAQQFSEVCWGLSGLYCDALSFVPLSCVVFIMSVELILFYNRAKII